MKATTLRATTLICILTILSIPIATCAMATEQTSDQLSITIKGGLGVQAVVENTGNTTLENVSWEITVEKAGGIAFVLFGTKTGTIETLQPGENITIPCLMARLMPPTIGFGKVNITVTVGDVTEKAQGTLIGIFFVGVKEI